MLHWGINFSRNDLKDNRKKSAGHLCPGNFQQHRWLIPARWFGMRHRLNRIAIFP